MITNQVQAKNVELIKEMFSVICVCVELDLQGTEYIGIDEYCFKISFVKSKEFLTEKGAKDPG